MIDPTQVKTDVQAASAKSYNLYKSATDLIQSHPHTTFWLFILVWIATIVAMWG